MKRHGVLLLWLAHSHLHSSDHRQRFNIRQITKTRTASMIHWITFGGWTSPVSQRIKRNQRNISPHS
ncbi:hypothetical protein ATCV1_z226R [Acanthocystis turfacea chlorella virus 1]|uniref:Uncharacterized protein z226R n=1 Tax=Chlorovirus heliozoae TaxID=322019 RepID=A7K8I6_9PHYC|nr:hypothetical protein ATCV1_z226R [Acanthocystis turfacea chlorella virus 1]ABT16360.1 hypothetical protein ATCV1_z226R [Acanthocystis turfacea chlorella virus 1]